MGMKSNLCRGLHLQRQTDVGDAHAVRDSIKGLWFRGESTSLSGRHGLLSELGYKSGSNTGRWNQGRGSQSWWAQNHLKGL